MKKIAGNRRRYVVSALLPAESAADGTEQARPYVNEGTACYHEAGHAVAFWHYGIGLRNVTMRPPADSGHGGQTVTVDRGEITGPDELEKEMRCAAAGQIAQTRVFALKQVPMDNELIRRFSHAAEWVAANPDLPPFNDDTIFAQAALARDDEISEVNPDGPTGPASWVSVWREAEQLIRVELWPAVRAIAEELRRSEADLGDADVIALAVAAMDVAAR